MEITLEDAFTGCTRDIQVDVAARCEPCDGRGAKPGTGTRRCPTCQGAGEVIEDPCSNCGGDGRVEKRKTLTVSIPAGVDEGTRIRLSGEGEAGARGAAPGDLYIFLHLKRHALFEREGTTLFTRAPISFTTAALGGDIAIPGLDGSRHDIRIPAGIQSGKQLRHRGAGMPVLNGRGHGDLVIQIDVETPTKLTSEQRDLLEAFRKTETGEECPQSRGFFDRLKGMWEDLT